MEAIAGRLCRAERPSRDANAVRGNGHSFRYVVVRGAAQRSRYRPCSDRARDCRRISDNLGDASTKLASAAQRGQFPALVKPAARASSSEQNDFTTCVMLS
jgi:hypothetical protein